MSARSAASERAGRPTSVQAEMDHLFEAGLLLSSLGDQAYDRGQGSLGDALYSAHHELHARWLGLASRYPAR